MKDDLEREVWAQIDSLYEHGFSNAATTFRTYIQFLKDRETAARKESFELGRMNALYKIGVDSSESFKDVEEKWHEEYRKLIKECEESA